MEIPAHYQQQIARSPLLQGFTPDELRAFTERSQMEGFTPGHEILTEGNLYQGIWVLLEGTCEVVKRGPHRDSRLAVLEPGAVFGEMSFLQASTHSASVRAVDRVETLRLMRGQYDKLVEACPSAAMKIAANLVRILSDRLRRMDEWTCELVEHECDHRRHQEWQEFRSKLYTNLYE
ncbi:cyclic nucleotide-binding domain-containing protein [Planctomicrobium sp. SH664]|uniref:cyclic nucleotide-binding domain-containing protein n=1 Tax=Planctomicrobium sp. SH664 TaxID=3448125 RepID=UPI003F5C740F